MLMHREGQAIKQDLDVTSWDTVEGELVRFESRTSQGAGQIVTVGLNPEDVESAIGKCVTQLQMVGASCTATVGDFEACFEATAVGLH